MSRVRSGPHQRDTNVTGHVVRITHNLGSELVSARAEVPVPKRVQLLGNAGQSLLPTRLLLIDRPAFVRAQIVREAVFLNFGKATLHGALDDDECPTNALFVGDLG